MTNLSELKQKALKSSIPSDMLKENNLKTLHNLEIDLDHQTGNPSLNEKMPFLGFVQNHIIDNENDAYLFSHKEIEHIKDVIYTTRGRRYEQMFNAFVPCATELTESQIQRVHTMYDNGLLLARNLNKNTLAQYPANISLSGGAVRDFLFLKEASIKDLDFLISFSENDTHQYSPIFTKFFDTQDLEKKQKASSLTLDKNSWLSPIFFSLMMKNGISLEYQNSDVYKKNLQIFFENIIPSTPKYIEIQSSFEFSSFLRYELEKNGFVGNEAVYIGLFDHNLLSQMKWEDYINQGLGATIKTKGINDIPMDLLVAKNSMIDIIHSFDFCICKSSINFSKILDFDKEHPAASSEDKITFIYENLFVPQTALTDVKLKELSISLQYLADDEKIRYFMDKHGQRLLEKYPDFTFNIPNSKFHIAMKRHFMNIVTKKQIYDKSIEISQNNEDEITDFVPELFKL